ncbi:PTS transporter subunit IIC [Pediococcus siamensis]|uniref:PTS transporter subunit IIC n=1 Tax=Pediococcus siamensis TaxID=381829 RepID=UPI0039A0E497
MLISKYILDIYNFLGVIPIMALTLILVSCLVGVHFFDAFESGTRLAISLTGISAIIHLLVKVYKPAMSSFINTTGIHLTVIDVGWAPLATITWGTPYTLLFLLITILTNLFMIKIRWTTTLDVDIFDIWHVAFTALLAMYFGANIFTAVILVIVLGILKLKNSDLMKPTFNDLLNNWNNPMTSTHMNYMINPLLMLFNKIFDIFLSPLDKYDFDVSKLNEKIGFWGSNFIIGCYLGVFVGMVGKMPGSRIFVLSFTGGVALQLFAEIGAWFVKAVDGLTQRITELLNKFLKNRNLNVGLDWAFINERSEIWGAANILAPIMLIESLVLPGNHILPLGGIIAMGVTPALLVVTQGHIIRMIFIGALELPLFLWAGTLSAPFVTQTVSSLSVSGIQKGIMIGASTKEGPIEQFLAYLFGKASSSEKYMLYAFVALTVYLLVFYWYSREMQKRNKIYWKFQRQQGESN